jgi:hypothetical protein
VLATLVITICIGASVLEMFDRWDHTLQDGNDTEANLVVVVLCIGIGFVAAAAFVKHIRPDGAIRLIARDASSIPASTSPRLTFAVFSATGPPAPLRV